jgi:hypothetical protein
MSIKTLLRYLIGNRDAILQIATNRRALWLGLLFVLSAGFAREYDGEDLLREPWHLLLPLGASLGSSLLLFLLIELAASLRKFDGSILSRYRTFLGPYWMTAPLAWLYAVPVERFLSAADAVRANLWLLGVVALWRMALMIRVISVLYGTSVRSALALVMLFADTVVLILVFTTPIPIVSIMGGIRLTESEQIIQGTVFLVGFLEVITWPIWFIGSLVVITSKKTKWDYAVQKETTDTVHSSVWFLAACSLVMWVFILPLTQPEQRLRGDVERLLKAGHIEEGLALMSAHDEKEFPPHWDPPPRVNYGRNRPSILDVMEIANSGKSAQWVRTKYLEKFISQIGSSLNSHDSWSSLTKDEINRHLTLLENLPERQEILDSNYSVFEGLMDFASYGGHKIEDSQRIRIVTLLKKSGKKIVAR